MSETKERLRFLDSLRGFTIFLMIPINAAMEYNSIPFWFKHASSSGVLPADFIMPSFLFALGISSCLSFQKRIKRDGILKTVWHLIYRNLILFAAGSIGFFLVYKQKNWEILQMLGLVGLISIPFLFLPKHLRLISSFLIILFVEIFRKIFFQRYFNLWYSSGIGGPSGAIPLSSIVIGSSAFGEYIVQLDDKRKVSFSIICGLTLILIANIINIFQKFNKHLLTSSYLLLTSGIAIIFLAIFIIIDLFVKKDIPILCSLGRNPLLCYIFGGILTLIARFIFGIQLSALYAWIVTFIVLIIVCTLAVFLDKKKLWLKL